MYIFKPLAFCALFLTLFLSSCSTTKFVPDGSYLLDDLKIYSDNKDVDASTLRPYVKQNPNSRWFSLVKMQLYVYNLSSKKSNNGFNRFLRRIGDAPVIYSENATTATQRELKKELNNRGYLSSEVKTTITKKKKKLSLEYHISSGKPYKLKEVNIVIDDDRVAKLMARHNIKPNLKVGDVFNVEKLENERLKITSFLRDNGYYKFNKEFITYQADTISGEHAVALSLILRRNREGGELANHTQYKIRKIGFVTDYDMMASSSLDKVQIADSVIYDGIPFYSQRHLSIRPKVLTSSLYLKQNDLYSEDNLQKTYRSLGRLNAIKYSNIHFLNVPSAKQDTALLDCYLLLTQGKHKSISYEVEGNNSAGDLGTALSVSLQHRNLFRGSETFTLKLRGAYEMVSGLDQKNYQGDHFFEFGANANLNFPRFLFPFLNNDFRRQIKATSELGIQYNYQLRPEFSRTIASARWSYRWRDKRRNSHRFDLIDVNFLYMPWISPEFRNKYLEQTTNSILKYNYQNRLIVNMGYSYRINKPNRYNIRIGFESAGNLLYAISKLSKNSKNDKGEYKFLNIPYAQYLKGDFDYSQKLRFDPRNSLAFHFLAGVAFPYGNAKNIPLEKRYFSGGANSLRGWSVRDLGPGSFKGDGNFLNQSGDIKLDASIEFRTKLFWKLNGAVFVDAGNIWTIRDYKDQPGGVFKFDKFYKQIAMSYGLGLRFDFDFFVLRLDGGMKAINPQYSSGKDRYPITNPSFKRDFAFHLAVGYPF